MSTVDQSRAGMCAAYGCPLFATVGSDGKWFCFCHGNRTHASNRFGYTDEWGTVKAGIARALREANRADLLPGERDCRNGSGQPELRAWLQRLERELIDLTRHVGEQMQLPRTVPTAPVIGPTHATAHFSDTANRALEDL